MNKIALISLSLILALVVGLAGCGGEGLVTQTVLVNQTQTVTQPGQTVTRAIIQIVTKTATVTTTPLPITTASPPITVTTTVTQEPPPPEQAYLVTDELSFIITEKTDYYWYFSWQVTIKNMTSYAVYIYIDVDFLDKDGFLIDWDFKSNYFNPNKEGTLRGLCLIDASVAPDVVEAVLGEVNLLY